MMGRDLIFMEFSIKGCISIYRVQYAAEQHLLIVVSVEA